MDRLSNTFNTWNTILNTACLLSAPWPTCSPIPVFCPCPPPSLSPGWNWLSPRCSLQQCSWSSRYPEGLRPCCSRLAGWCGTRWPRHQLLWLLKTEKTKVFDWMLEFSRKLLNVLTNAYVVRKAANVNVSGVLEPKLATESGVSQFFVVPKHGIRVDFGICALVDFNGVVDNLQQKYQHTVHGDALRPIGALSWWVPAERNSNSLIGQECFIRRKCNGAVHTFWNNK